jgi:hypothetical protein
MNNFFYFYLINALRVNITIERVGDNQIKLTTVNFEYSLGVTTIPIASIECTATTSKGALTITNFDGNANASVLGNAVPVTISGGIDPTTKIGSINIGGVPTIGTIYIPVTSSTSVD